VVLFHDVVPVFDLADLNVGFVFLAFDRRPVGTAYKQIDQYISIGFHQGC
jgi:hypothetical protein